MTNILLQICPDAEGAQRIQKGFVGETPRRWQIQSYCGGHWSFPTFSINFAAPHLGFQILQVLVQGLKAEEEGAESTSVETAAWKSSML